MRHAVKLIYAALIILPLICVLLARAETDKPTQNTKTGEESISGKQDISRAPGDVVVIQINGSINPGTLDYIRTGLDEATEKRADALVIQMDTPGGLLSSTKEIVKLILNAEVPVIVYVSPSGASATSAGVFITLAANIAAMAPGTSIGAAHPVSIGSRDKKPDEKKEKESGKDKKDKDEDEEGEEEESDVRSQEEIMGEKILNYASSFIQSIAEQRGRNVEWAIDAVRNSSSITANEALEKNVIDLISPSLTKLLDEIDGRKVEVKSGETVLHTKGASIIRIAMSAKQIMIDLLSTPDIALLLMSLGSLGLLLEFYSPGLLFPGVAGLVCLLMGFVSFQILPFNYAGLALILLAIGLFVTEVYMTSYGLLSLGGIICFALGALLLFDTPDSDIRVTLGTVIAMTASFGVFFLFVAYYLVKAQKLDPQLGFEGIIGETGEAVSDFDKTGKIFLLGEYWDAESDEQISTGDKIEVLESMKGLKLKVKKIDV